MLYKRDIRSFLAGFLARPEVKWQAQLAFLDRVFLLAWTAILSVTAFATSSGGALVMLLTFILVVLLFVYTIAKGK